jgi:hypothetical protein
MYLNNLNSNHNSLILNLYLINEITIKHNYINIYTTGHAASEIISPEALQVSYEVDHLTSTGLMFK